MQKLNCVSVNVRGLNTDEKRIKLYSWLTDINTDVIFLQETHYVKKYEFKYNTRWPGESFHYYSDSSHSRGVSILLRKNIPLEVLNVHKSIDGRKLLLNVKYDNNITSFVNVYAPNNEADRISFFKRLQSFINQNSMNLENVLMCGDLNCILNKERDKSAKVLQNITTIMNMSDTWHDLHEQLSGFTWCDGNDIPKSRIIDCVFLTENFIYNLDKIIIRRIPGTHSNGYRLSDHGALKFSFKLCDNKRGSGYWKLNTSFFENADYINGIKDVINSIRNGDKSYIERWELVKYEIKQFSIRFSRNYHSSIRKRITDIENEISNIEDSASENINMTRKRLLEN